MNHEKIATDSTTTIFGLSLVIFLCCIAYLPGLNGEFVFDDIPNIVKNRALTETTEWDWQKLVGATLSSNAGPFHRPVSMFSLTVNHIYSGLDPYAYKLTNLIIHILTGLGIFTLSLQLLRATKLSESKEIINKRYSLLALCIASIWLLHPLNLTPVLYIVQRMTSLSALFTVWGMVFYLMGRIRLSSSCDGVWFVLSSILVFGTLAILSKENAALLPIYLLLIEWLFFRTTPVHSDRKLLFRLFISLGLMLPVILGLIYQTLNWESLLASYDYRPFSLAERLMTEARVVWFYAYMTLTPNIQEMTLYHDDIVISHNLINPSSTLVALVGLIIILFLTVKHSKKHPIVAFGILFFLIGHSMESTIYSLEIAHEHRNYLPGFGLIIGCAFIFHRLFKRFTLSRKLTIFIGILVPLVLATGTHLRADYWSDNLKRSLHEVANHPRSPRSHSELGYIYAQLADIESNHAKSIEYLETAYYHFNISMQLDNYTLIGDLATIAIGSKLNIPLDQKHIEELTVALREPPIAPVTVTSLLELSHCQLAGKCDLPNHVIDNLLAAALDNPTLTRLAPINLLTELAQRSLREKKLSRALEYAQLALQKLPANPQVHLNYASILYEIGDTEAATKHIKIAKTNDTNNIYSLRIDRLDQSIYDTRNLMPSK